MARKQLTDSTIQKALRRATPYKITDAKGLFIQIQPTGAKLWRYRYRINGKENVFAMGEYAQPMRAETESAAKARRGGCQFTLEEARQQRIAARNLVRQGVHPAQHR